MELIDWYKENNVDLETIEWIESLRRNTPYTNDEIIEAVNEVYRVGKQCGLTFKQSVACVCAVENGVLK